MSAWVKARNAGQSAPAGTHATLGRCRSMARQAKQAESHGNAGNDLKAQSLRSRVARAAAGDAPITKAERSAKAKALASERVKKNAAKAKSKEANPFGDDDGLFDTAKAKKLAAAEAKAKAAARAKAGPEAKPKTAADAKPTKPAAVERRVRPDQSKIAAVRESNPSADTVYEKALEVAGGRNVRGYINELRDKFPNMSRPDFDSMLLKMGNRGDLNVYRLDNPREHNAARLAGGLKTPSGEDRHIYYAGRGGDSNSPTTPPSSKKTVHLAGAPASGSEAPALKPVADAKPSPAAIRKADAPRRAKTAEKVKTFRASELEHKAPHQFGKVGKTYDFDTDKVAFDPERFQYKMGAQGSHGVTDALGDVKKWDAELAGSVSLWRDPANGKTYVVNGHHRLDLAKKLGVKKITGKLIDAKDAGEARAKGAIVNIAEGRGTAVDAAKFFREQKISPDALRARGVSLRESTAQQGLAMSQLSDRAFRRLSVEGSLSTNRAAIIGGAGLSHEQQDQLLKVLDKPKNARITDGTVRAMAEDARAAGSRTREVKSLFGSSAEEEALFVHRAKLTDSIGRSLAADRKLFGLVSKSKAAEALAERGRSTIDTGETGKVSAESAAVLQAFKQLRNRHPAVSRLLNQGAERLGDGAKEKEVIRETRSKIAAQLKRILSGEDDPFG